MKIYLFILLTMFPLLMYSQQKDDLLQQIEKAQNFEEMPQIRVVVMRDANRIGRKLSNYNTLQRITKGDTLNLYYPIRIYDSGRWTRADESFNYIVLGPEMNNETLIVNQNIILHLNNEDKNLFIKWIAKFEKLGKALQKTMLEDGALI